MHLAAAVRVIHMATPRVLLGSMGLLPTQGCGVTGETQKFGLKVCLKDWTIEKSTVEQIGR